MEFNELKDMPIGDILKLTTFKFGELGVYYKNITIDTDMEDGASPKKFDLDMGDPDIVADLIDPDILLGEAYDMWNFSDDCEPTSTSGILTNIFGGFGNIDNFVASVFDGYRDGINNMQGSEGNEAMDEIAEWEFPDPDDDDYDDDENGDDWEDVQLNRDSYRATVHFQWCPYYYIECTYSNDDGSYFDISLLHTSGGWIVKKL